MDVPIEQDDLNQKFLTSLAPEWLVYTIVWRNMDDLDTMSLDDVYNHLKVYEPEVQKRAGSNSQNIAFMSSSNTNSGKLNLSYNIVCAFIATQPNGSQIKYEDISQIDDDDIKELDIKWNLALLCMRADRFWKKTGKKITIQRSDVASFDKSKVECFNCHKMGHFAKECGSPKSQDREKIGSYKKDPKVEEPAPKFVDDTVIDYSRPTPSIDVSKDVSDEQKAIWKSNSASSFEQGASFGNVVSKPMIRFVKETGCPSVSKVNNNKNSRKPTVKYAEMYRNTSQSPRVMGNQRN
ncbi:ribonuclease H-like domain-containing protein [Tanacetum coccineum]